VSEFPEGWIVVPIGDINLFKSKNIDPKINSEVEFELYSVPAFPTGKPEITIGKKIGSTKQLVDKEDVLLCKINPRINRVWKVLEKTKYLQIASSEWIVIRNTLLNSDYLRYAIRRRSFRDLLCSEVSGVGGSLTRAQPKKVATYPIPLAPLPEQNRIANKLDLLLAKVETTQTRLNKIPTILKRFRQSVLNAATSGGLTKEWRLEHPGKTTQSMLDGFEVLKKPPRYKSRSDSFIQGVIATSVGKPEEPLVPAWEWVPIIDVAKMESGHTPSRYRPEYWGGKVGWVGIKDARLHHSKTIFQTMQTINELGLKNSASRLLPEDTVCVSRTASVGYVVKLGKSMATSQDFVNWVPTRVVDSDWLKWLFVSERESLLRYGKGTTHTTVYFPEWLSLHIALPHIDEQKEIVRQVESLFALAESVEQQYFVAKNSINKLTQSLLAKAFRGELVPQDLDDEPTEKLLERIRSERSQQEIKTKHKRKIKKTTSNVFKIPTAKLELTPNVFQVVVSESRNNRAVVEMKLHEAPKDYLFSLVKESGGKIHADSLWKKSRMSIDDFYCQLKLEEKNRKLFEDKTSPDPSQRILKVVR
jgi:type I restriction enzyme S subunit